MKTNAVSVNSKNKKYTLVAWLLALLVLAVAIPINLIFDRLDYTFDMTGSKLYTLSDTTTNYLDQLDAQGIVVDVYFLQDLDELASDLEWVALYRTLLAYDEHECFHLIANDPDLMPDTFRELNQDGRFNLDGGDFLFVYNGMAKRLPGNLIYVYKFSESNPEVVESAEFRAENYFTGYMKTVVDGVLPKIYFLEGHGETPISEMTQLTANLANNNYGAESLNLINLDAVPEDACIVAAIDPQFDMTAEEYDKLYAYTKTGGNLIMTFAPNADAVTYTNFEKLTRTFCIGMEYNRIHESDSDRHKTNDPFIFMCDLQAATDEDGDVTGELMNTSLLTYMPESRSFFEIYNENYSGCQIATQMRTASTAVAEPYGGTLEDANEVTGATLTVAMHSKDSLRDDAKLAVFGSGAYLKDSVMMDEDIGTFFLIPLQLVLSTITWMYDADVDMNIADKPRDYDSLNVNSSKEASTLIAIFTAYPIIIAAAGVVIWLRRRDA